MKNITGTLIKNFFHCKREAYLYYYGVNFSSDIVRIGELMHEEHGSREIVFEKVKVDDIKNDVVVELKKSSSNIEGSKFQLLYYLSYFKSKGLNFKGKIIDLSYNEEYEVVLDEKTELELKKVLFEIEVLLKGNIPDRKKNKKDCKNCSFFDYCWVD